MKPLKEHILEGILDIENNINYDISKDVIEEFLKDNYNIKGVHTIKKTKNGFAVDVDGGLGFKEKFGKELTSLTNDYFVFGKVTGNFDCDYAENLESLKGAPKEINGPDSVNQVTLSLDCSWCTALKSLEGCTPNLKAMSIEGCKSLKSLQGAPKVHQFFNAKYCGFTESDVTKEIG